MALATSSVESFATHVVGAHFAFRDDARDGGFQTHGLFVFFQPVEHQLRGQQHGDRIHLVLAGVFRCRTVCRFKHRVIVAAFQIFSVRFTSAVEYRFPLADFARASITAR